MCVVGFIRWIWLGVSGLGVRGLGALMLITNGTKLARVRGL